MILCAYLSWMISNLQWIPNLGLVSRWQISRWTRCEPPNLHDNPLWFGPVCISKDTIWNQSSMHHFLSCAPLSTSDDDVGTWNNGGKETELLPNIEFIWHLQSSAAFMYSHSVRGVLTSWSMYVHGGWLSLTLWTQECGSRCSAFPYFTSRLLSIAYYHWRPSVTN